MRLMQAAKVMFAALSLVSFTAASAQDQMTTRERKALPPRAANRSVQQDLLSVFEPVRRIDSGMLRQLRGIGLTTHAFGTEFKGLCRRDVVSLRYAPTGPSLKPEDAPVQPYSVEAQAWFHIISLSQGEHEESRPDVWQSSCVSAGQNESATWFAARDARTAVRGALVLEAALSAIRNGALKSEPCPNIFDPKKSTCEDAILANGSPSKIDSIEACSSDSGTVCYDVDLATSTKLTIKARMAEDALYPSTVLSIAIEQYIVVT